MSEVTLTISAEDSASEILTKVTQGLDKLAKGSGAAGGASKKAGDEAKAGAQGFDRFASSLNDAAANLKNMLTPANLLGSVIGVGVVASLRHAISETTQFAMEMQRLHLVTGASLTEIGELQDAASKLGIGVGKLQRAFFLMSSEVESGGRSLAKLGISARDASGAQRSSIELLGLISEKLRAITSATEQAVVARKTFGRGAADLLPLFTLEKKQLEELGESGREFNRIFGMEGVKSSILLGGAVDEVREAFMRMHITLIGDIAPGIKLVAAEFAKLLDVFWAIPKPVRLIGEVIVASSLVLGGAALAVKALAGGFASLFAVLKISALVSFAGTIGGMAVPIGVALAALTALLILGPPLKEFFSSLIPQGVIDKWVKFKSAVAEVVFQLKNLFSARSLASTDEGARALARIGAPTGENADREQTLAELQLELQLKHQLLQAEVGLAKVTKDTLEAELKASKARQQQAVDTIDVELKKLSSDPNADPQILEQRRKLETTKTKITETGVAERRRLFINEQVAALEHEAELQKITLSRQFAGEELAKRTAEIEQTTATEKLAILKSGGFAFLAETRAQEKAVLASQTTLSNQLLQIEREKISDKITLLTKLNDIDLTHSEFQKNLALSDLEEERQILQDRFETYIISHSELSNNLIDIAGRERDIRKQILDEQTRNAITAAELQIRRIQEQAKVGPMAEEKMSAEISQIKTDLVLKLIGLENKRTIADQEFADKRTEIHRQESRQAGVLFAQEAGRIEEFERKRQQSIQNTSLVLEQQARVSGDLFAVMQVGFVEAASSANDAFSEMKNAGLDAYQALRSGFSDFLFDLVDGAKNIESIFLNLGKRILRSFTDAFAGILIKQTLLSAGFSLPNLIVPSAATGLENASNQTAQAISILGNASGQTANLLGFFSGALNTTSQIIGLFGSGIMSVLQFLGSLLSGGLSSIGSFLPGSGGSILNALSSGLTSITTAISSGFSAFFGGTSAIPAGMASAGGMASGVGTAGSVGLMQQGLSFITQATPWIAAAYGLYQMFSGRLSPMSGALQGAAIGTMILPGPGTVIGAVAGTIAGFLSGLFGGPKPQISGLARLGPTDPTTLLNAQVGPAISPPGRSHFSFVSSGPLLVEMHKFRTQGKLNRDESTIAIATVILETLKAATNALTKLAPRLPTTALSQALSDRINAVLAEGFEITDFNFKGSAKKVVKKFRDFLEGLAGETLQVYVEKIFGAIDLAALGAGDAVKGFDALTLAMASFGALLESHGNTALVANDTIAQFATRSIEFFQRFQKEGEAFTDTIKRIMDAFQTISQMQDRAQLAMAQLLRSPTLSIEILSRQLQALQTQATNAAAQLAILASSSTDPDELAQAASSVEQITAALNQAASSLISAFRSLIDQMENAAGLYVDLSISINQLSNQEVSGRAIQFFSALFDRITDVTSRLATFSQMAKLLASDLDAFNSNTKVFSFQFSQLLSQISGLTPDQAVPALQQLAGIIQTTLSSTIDQVHSEFANRRSILEVGLQQAHASLELNLRQGQEALEVRLREEARLREDNLRESLQQAENIADQQRDQIRSIFDERKQALQSELEYVRNIRKFAEGLVQYRQQLTDLLAPTHPVTSFDAARAQMRAAFAQFLVSPTLESQESAFSLAKRTIELAQQTPGYDLPSQQFAALVDEVNGILNALEQSSRQVRTEEAILSDIKQLDVEQSRLLTEIDVDIQQMRRRIEAEIRASATSLENALQASSASVEAELQIANASMQATLDALSQQEQDAIEQLQQVAADRLDQIRTAIALQLNTLVGQTLTASAQLQAIFGVRDLDQLIAQNSTQQIQLLSSINAALNAFLQRLGISPPAGTSPSTGNKIEPPEFPNLLNTSVFLPGQGWLNLMTGLIAPIKHTPGGPEEVTGSGFYKSEPTGTGLEQTINGVPVPGQGIISSTGLFIPSKIIGFERGTDFVSQTGLALLHRGEAVIPASENQRGLNRSSQQVTFNLSPTIHISVDGNVNQAELTKMLDRALAALIVGPSRSRAEMLNLARHAERR